MNRLLHFIAIFTVQGFSGGSDGKGSAYNAGDLALIPGSDPWIRKIPWRRKWHPTPVILPGEFHGQTSLADYSPWGCKELDMIEQLTLSLLPSYPASGTLTQFYLTSFCEILKLLSLMTHNLTTGIRHYGSQISSILFVHKNDWDLFPSTFLTLS